ncbi:hypothetical protein CSC32_1165 [Pseudomonas aeruginosa]|nr:hypothetical protein CSC32_1165 [Pseudomonas aeruginosa]
MPHMPEDDANGTESMNMDIHQKRSDLAVIPLAHSSGNTQQIEIAVALHVEVDRYHVVLCHAYALRGSAAALA